MKTLKDDKLTLSKMIVSFFYRVENIERKGKNTCHDRLLLSIYCFKKPL